ncbi:hypothetical protein DS2_05405 [Catenovulum agarivorans DS-2]|uniref:ExoP galactose-binding-like domain-containing protein n=1 Tax=Catenovulum agarivorans DS-2 TaxID=1328313 RepID=W7QDJ6_9ALTE|nr:putative glycoside hydrolase [Catenovulum agarivorans]EWH10979.1 hypothetical protein DS2_05405 [Catenovulum agarivorans DS-2]
MLYLSAIMRQSKNIVNFLLITSSLAVASISYANNPLTDYIVEGNPVSPWKLGLGNAFSWSEKVENQQGKTKKGNLSVTPTKRNKQGDAINVKWRGKYADSAWFSILTLNGHKVDISSVEDQAALNLEVRVHRYPNSIAKIGMRCNWKNECKSELPLNALIKNLPKDEWSNLTIPLNCFNQDGQFDFKNLTDIFMISTQGKMEFDIAATYLVGLPQGNTGCKKQ